MTTPNSGPDLWLVLASCLAPVTVLVLITNTTSGPLRAALAVIVAGAGGLAIRSRHRHAQALQRDQDVLNGFEPLGRPDQDAAQ